MKANIAILAWLVTVAPLLAIFYIIGFTGELLTAISKKLDKCIWAYECWLEKKGGGND